MADKPSRALIIYGDGLARSIGLAHNHLHSLASRACCGFLSLPHSPPSEIEDARIVREIAELLDASESYEKMVARETVEDKLQEKYAVPTISERFMGMKAAIVTNSLTLKSFGSELGFTVLRLDSMIDDIRSPTKMPLLGSELLKLLGFQGGKTLDTSQFDLVFVHMGQGEKTSAPEEMELLNGLVGELMHSAQPGTDIGSRLHTSIVMSYGATLDDDISRFLVSGAKGKNGIELSLLFPRQSYTLKGGKPQENIRHHCPMLFAQWQNAVTRKDAVQEFSFDDFNENAGNLVIPADRFLHEIAFKLWKSPKYGA